MKKYVVLDWYEDLTDPDLIGFFDTMAEANEACDKWEEETDGECNCIIYPTDNPKCKKIVAIAKRLEKEGE